MNVETQADGTQIVTMVNGQKGKIVHLALSNQCTVKFDGKDDMVNGPNAALAWMQKQDQAIREDRRQQFA